MLRRVYIVGNGDDPLWVARLQPEYENASSISTYEVGLALRDGTTVTRDDFRIPTLIEWHAMIGNELARRNLETRAHAIRNAQRRPF